ncbi:MAG: type II secretion system protein [Planctomycetota bacterium]|jgi:prepilin-type N-terminal cleavage/methylation domain-containing protein
MNHIEQGDRRKRGPVRRGFTLTESLLAVTLLAMAISAITLPFTTSAESDVEDAQQSLAAALAAEMMEEIHFKPFDDPDGPSALGPEAGESSRSKFDNVDDYDDYEEAIGSITDAFGNVADEPMASTLSRSVSVDYVYLDGQDAEETPVFCRVTVQVMRAGEPMLTLTRLKYGGW